MRRGVRSILIGLAVLTAAGPAVVGAQTIKIGAVVPLTGRYGGGGAQVRAGYELAIEHLNAAGGVTVGGKNMPGRGNGEGHSEECQAGIQGQKRAHSINSGS